MPGAPAAAAPTSSCFPSFPFAAIPRAIWSSGLASSDATGKRRKSSRERRQGIAVICGLVTPAHSSTGKSVLNSAALLRDGKIAFVQSKRLLPTYDVFDEMRNFAPAEHQQLVALDDRPMALTICEDAWNDKHFWDRRLYGVDPVEDLIGAGGKILLNISASPFYLRKRELRRDMLAAIARKYRVPVAMVNQIGGNDSLVFDGSSLALGPDGEVIAQAKSFEEDLVCFDTDSLTGDMRVREEESGSQRLRRAGAGHARLRSQMRIPASGAGLERRDRFGADGLHCGRCAGTRERGRRGHAGTLLVAGKHRRRRGIGAQSGHSVRTGSHRRTFSMLTCTASAGVRRTAADVTEENIQARIRGSLMMAMSNKFGALLLTTGNKSEIARGLLHAVRRYVRRAGGHLRCAQDAGVSPVELCKLACALDSASRRIEKPPSAELRPGQKDSDSLPPTTMCWTTFWKITSRTTSSPDAIAAAHGYEPELVRKVACMVDRSEYKRQQAAPG